MWESIKKTFRSYFRFSGRADRKEFWIWASAMIAVSITFTCILAVTAFVIALLFRNTDSPVLTGVFAANITLLGVFWLVMFFPTLTVTVRRLRDAGIMPWLLIIPAIFGIFTFLVLCDQALYNMDPSTPPHYSGVFAFILTSVTAMVGITFLILFCLPSKK